MTIYILNTLIVPINFDVYQNINIKLTKISIEEAKEILKNGFISAIGHEGTSQILTKLLGILIPTNRITIFMKPGDVGIHFFLKQRLPEGTVLSEEQLNKLEFWLVKSEVY
jgi:hypothetical protein